MAFSRQEYWSGVSTVVLERGNLSFLKKSNILSEEGVKSGQSMSYNNISSTFSKSSLNIWNFSVHIQLKPALENFEHYFASVVR